MTKIRFKMQPTGGTYSEEELRQQFKAATRRAAAADRVEPRAVSARYEKRTNRIVVELTTGVVVSFPPAVLQGLTAASPHDLAQVVVSSHGTALHWENLDADFSVPDLLAGVFGTRAWMADLGRKGGRTTSEAKVAAARVNGRKGGRPPKGGRDTPSDKGASSSRQRNGTVLSRKLRRQALA